MERIRIRWRNVARLAAGVGAIALGLSFGPALLKPAPPPPLPDDLGLAPGAAPSGHVEDTAEGAGALRHRRPREPRDRRRASRPARTHRDSTPTAAGHRLGSRGARRRGPAMGASDPSAAPALASAPATPAAPAPASAPPPAATAPTPAAPQPRSAPESEVVTGHPPPASSEHGTDQPPPVAREFGFEY